MRSGAAGETAAEDGRGRLSRLGGADDCDGDEAERERPTGGERAESTQRGD